jgi:hypothetical protein
MSKTEKIMIVLNQMILLSVAAGGIKIRSNPFDPFDPFCHPVAFGKKRRSLKKREAHKPS